MADIKRTLSMKIAEKFTCLFLILNALLFSNCSGNYKKKNGKVYFVTSSPKNRLFGRTRIEIKDADYHSFKLLDKNIPFAKDKNHIYLASHIYDIVDYDTFEHMKDYYWKDKNHIYLYRFGMQKVIIEGADVSSFCVLKDHLLWAKDKHHVYYKFDRLKNVNINTFGVIAEDWAKDDHHYFWHSNRIDSMDYESAKRLSAYYIKDKKQVYYKGVKVDACDAATFVVLGSGVFGYDRSHIYHGTENRGIITEAFKRRYKIN
jgi:hypothetical protein